MVAAMLIAYAVLDGFDLGAGIVHLFVARANVERRAVLASIGPVWDGNEVWLIAGGSTLFFAFPAVYASGFQGFYLPLMIVLWLLVLRGIAIPFRSHIESLVWQPFWDAVFAGASALLALFFGATLGNVVRGVPIGESGFFFLPLWANLRVIPTAGIFDWFTIIVGLGSVAALAVHGALWVAMKTGGDVARRARQAADAAWWLVLVITALLVIIVPLVQPQFQRRFTAEAWGFILPFSALAGLLGVKVFSRAGSLKRAFASSSLYIAGMLASAAFGLYPYLLPSSINPLAGLSVYNSAAADYGLRAGLFWLLPGMVLVAAYSAFVYGYFTRKVGSGEGTY